jgi:hypothetical protein
MSTRVRFAVCAVSILFIVGAAQAQLSSDQLKCQGAVAKKGRVFFKKRFKAIEKCRESINKGTLDTTTDCEVETKTQPKLDAAETKYRDAIGAACSDMVVGGLDFGGLCFGVTTKLALQDCAVQEHENATDALITTIYNNDTAKICSGGTTPGVPCTTNANCSGMGTCIPEKTQRVCDGGTNDGNPCFNTSDCPPSGACVMTADQQSCVKTMAKALSKLEGKRQSILQKCKKSVAKNTLPLSTDCVATSQAQLDSEFTKAVTAIQTDCPAMVAASMRYGNACNKQTDTDSLAACGTCSVDHSADELILVQHGSSAHGGTAVAKQISNAVADCVGGPMSRCRVNDYLLKNDKIRVIVQDVQRNIFGIGEFGGQIIDGDLVRTSGPDRDAFQEWSISLNVEGTAHYTSLTILNDGSNGGPAVIRATGVDDLLDFINPSSVVANFGFLLPAGTDDTNIPVTVTTDYILEPGTNYVRVETTVQNTGAAPLNIFFGEFINGGGQAEMFQPGYGFGEPLASSRCLISKPNLCNFTAYTGEEDSDGVSYGYVQNVGVSSTFTTSGVHVPQLNTEIVLALIGIATAPFHMAANGNPGDAIEFTRYFVVGKGSVSDVSDARNEIQCVPTGRLHGNVTAGGGPAVRADVAVLDVPANGPQPTLTYNVITHARTDDSGNYSFTLPAGNYNVVANLDGSPYEGGGSSAMQHAVAIAAFGDVTQDIAIPMTGGLHVTVVDENNQPIPAKVSVVGFDPSSDPTNNQSIFGLINNKTNLYGDRTKDFMPFGINTVIRTGVNGDTGVVPLEPAQYQVVVSRGPEYSIDAQNVTITAGATTNVSAKVERVVDSTGFVAADFHVHSLNSPDSRIPLNHRVMTMLDEGMDFYTPTDHDFRTNAQPTINALGASSLLGTATGEEITSFDYGHFNAWPLIIDPSQVNGGAVDFGGAAPAGQDYPSSGYYNESPATIIALAHADAPGANNTVQINHIHSFFGLDGGSGLAVDTGVNPPASAVPAAARRLNPATMNFFSASFDALEIWIGDDRNQILNNFLGTLPNPATGGNIGDWFNLINQGIVRTGVSDSDTHTRAPGVAGFPRNMVASPTDNAGALSAIADTLSANVNAGHSFGTNGPMVRVSAHAVSTNEDASLEDGDNNMLSTSDGDVDITVDIQSPTWIDFDRVEFYVNTKTTRRTLLNKQTGAGLVNVKRYSITPDFVQNAPANFTVTTDPVMGTMSSRHHAVVTQHLTGLIKDTWVVVLVKGTDGISRPLFPVLPNSLKTSTNTNLMQLTDGNLGEDGITALAFTNPILVDVDGGGWTAPGLNIAP